MKNLLKLQQIASNQPHRLLFATVSGAHLYGFASQDSDYDLRGIHILPTQTVLGLDPGQETIEVSEIMNDLELDLVTHDIKKFFSLLLKRNGYVLEQLFSPLIIHTTPEHQELKKIAEGCITHHHSHYYLGFAKNQWQLFAKEQFPRVKPLLYVYRVLLTGINLMRTGRIEANLSNLNQEFKLSYLDELIEQKISATEKVRISNLNLEFYLREYERLSRNLEKIANSSHLPAIPSAKSELNDLLIRLRLSN